MVSVIQKVSPHASFAKYILCSTGLIHYLHLTDDELKTLAGVPKDKPKGKKEEKGKMTPLTMAAPSMFQGIWS